MVANRSLEAWQVLSENEMVGWLALAELVLHQEGLILSNQQAIDLWHRLSATVRTQVLEKVASYDEDGYPGGAYPKYVNMRRANILLGKTPTDEVLV